MTFFLSCTRQKRRANLVYCKRRQNADQTKYSFSVGVFLRSFLTNYRGPQGGTELCHCFPPRVNLTAISVPSQELTAKWPWVKDNGAFSLAPITKETNAFSQAASFSTDFLVLQRRRGWTKNFCRFDGQQWTGLQQGVTLFSSLLASPFDKTVVWTSISGKLQRLFRQFCYAVHDRRWMRSVAKLSAMKTRQIPEVYFSVLGCGVAQSAIETVDMKSLKRDEWLSFQLYRLDVRERNFFPFVSSPLAIIAGILRRFYRL